MDIYRELILDHYKHPRNFGHLDKPDVVVEEGNVTCGDKISIELKVLPALPAQAGKSYQLSAIKDVRFSGQGCAISMAAASMLTEKVKGMKLEKIMNLTTVDIEEMVGTTLTPSRVKCAVLSLEVLQKAIGLVYSKNHGSK
jgi:nitrogen fixation NifU-like protein